MALEIDNREYPAAPDKNLLEHCLALGLDLPYFCWHPAMGSVGACRQCAVKLYAGPDDTRGRIVMACMTPAADGSRVGLVEAEASDFRARVIEWLMVNHPHDCPVCEEGGECHLQDMTVLTGHNWRRYRGRKRTFRNQYLGPFLNHEMNRCIACYRCVRFYKDIAGGDDLEVLGIRNQVYFGRREDGVLENEFSGNLAEVCPTGVFTDKPFSDRYVRKWDLESAPSICVHCSLGCNISAQARYGMLHRVVNRYHPEINGYFLCDRGRYGRDFVSAQSRVRRPLMRSGRGASLETVTPVAAIHRAAAALAEPIIGIGSPRASLEANHALRRLVGDENFYLGIANSEWRVIAAALAIAAEGSTRIPSLGDVARADAVLVLGEDPTHTAPRLALALRHGANARQRRHAATLSIPTWNDAAVRNAGRGRLSPLFIAAARATQLDDVAAALWRGTPEAITDVGCAIAHGLDAAAPEAGALPREARRLVEQAAGALGAAARPLVVAGGSGLAVVEAAANVARALARTRGQPADLLVVLPECNSFGVALLGGGRLEQGLERGINGKVGAAIVLENDLYRRAPAATIDRFCEALAHLLVLDHSFGRTVERADLVLPAASFAESEGTLVSSEGRAQRFFQALRPEADLAESWRWVSALARATGRAGEFASLDAVIDDLAVCTPALAGIKAAAPDADFRIVGRRIARETPRYSGRTAMYAQVEIRERKPPPDPDSPLAYSMEGHYGLDTPPALLPYVWAPGWNSNQSVHKFLDDSGHWQHGNPGVRLVEAQPELLAPQIGPYFSPRSSAIEPDDGTLRVVRLHHIFGGEEQSVLAPAIEERMPASYAALGPGDAALRGLEAGDRLEIDLNGVRLELPVEIDSSLAPGCIGLPWGLPDLPWVEAEQAKVTQVRRGGTP